MALELAFIPRRFLWFILAHHFIVVTACQEADYAQLIEDYCLSQFKFDMEVIGQTLWCDWDQTIGFFLAVCHPTADSDESERTDELKVLDGLAPGPSQHSSYYFSAVPKVLHGKTETVAHKPELQINNSYGELTNCTLLIAKKLDCFWPNQLVDEFFIAIHKHYFKNCSLSGRSLRDPPNNILCPFLVVPILITLLMTALVVWRSQQSEGIV